jgi:hypothetical protein
MLIANLPNSKLGTIHLSLITYHLRLAKSGAFTAQQSLVSGPARRSLGGGGRLAQW